VIIGSYGRAYHFYPNGKYNSRFDEVKLAFSRAFPSDIGPFYGQDVVFKPSSRLFSALEWDVLAQRAQGHIRGHRINYKPFAETAKEFIREIGRTEANPNGAISRGMEQVRKRKEAESKFPAIKAARKRAKRGRSGPKK